MITKDNVIDYLEKAAQARLEFIAAIYDDISCYDSNLTDLMTEFHTNFFPYLNHEELSSLYTVTNCSYIFDVLDEDGIDYELAPAPGGFQYKRITINGITFEEVKGVI